MPPCNTPSEPCDSAPFHEEQRFGKWHAALVLAMPPAGVVFIACRQLIWRHPWGNPPTSDGGMVFLSILAVLLYVRLVTVRLVTDLHPRELVIGMKGLWPRRRIPLDQVRAARAMEYDAIRDFGGYGIRSGRRGRAYIAHGNGAVELELVDGGRLFIGSQQPARLARQIRRR